MNLCFPDDSFEFLPMKKNKTDKQKHKLKYITSDRLPVTAPFQ